MVVFALLYVRRARGEQHIETEWPRNLSNAGHDERYERNRNNSSSIYFHDAMTKPSLF